MRSNLEFDQQIHARLLSHDVTASEDLASHYLEPVRRHLKVRAHSHGVYDEDLINDATIDAIFDYIRHPEKFDATKSGLFGYLKRAAERDLINAVKKDQRKRRAEELTGDVELTVISRKKSGEIERIEGNAENEVLAAIEAPEKLAHIIKSIADPCDRKLLELMAEGERRTSAFSAVLGIEEMPLTKQRKEVKRNKDRLKQQLKRLGEKRSV